MPPAARSRPDHRLLDRHRPRHRRAARRRGLDRLRDRAPARVDRRPRGRGLPAARARRRPTRRRWSRRSDAVEAGRGRGRRRWSTTPATASRARSRRCRSTQVRRQFETNVFGLRPADPARPAGMRRQALGPHRQRLLDGREAHLPGRRLLPRDQVRGRGDHRRAALRGARLRHRRGRHRARPDPHEFGEAAVGAMEADGAGDGADGPYAEFNARGATATKDVYEGSAAPSSAAARDGRRGDRAAISASRPKTR